ncbi:hypothetical protein E4U55_005490 [Claviceps digitariae]|nr:hypothetical protein E4U55_005490 [Claviceps digitariae]
MSSDAGSTLQVDQDERCKASRVYEIPEFRSLSPDRTVVSPYLLKLAVVFYQKSCLLGEANRDIESR